MYVCIYIYIYVIHIYIYMHIHMHACVHIYIYIYIYMFTYIYIHTCIYIYICMYVCMYVCMYIGRRHRHRRLRGGRCPARCAAAGPRDGDGAARCSDRDRLGKHSWVTAIFVLFDRGTFWVLPLTYFYIPKRCQGVPFSPICQNSFLLQRPHEC